MNDYSKYFMPTESAVDVVARQVSAVGNRSERRRILKALNKTEKITQHAQQRVASDAKKEINERSKDSFGFIMSMFGIVLHDKFGWDDEKIAEMFTEVSQRLDGEWAEGKTIEDVAKELFEKTGIELVVK